MAVDLTGRVALVTGAARGIGRATAERIIEHGASVAVNDINPSAAREAAEELGQNALAVAGDVADEASVATILATVLSHFGRVDILVNCAGILFPTRLGDITADEWRRTIEVNLTGVFLCIKAATPAMRDQQYGRIVNISSTAGKSVSTLGGAHYTASKAGVLGLTRAAAKELAGHGITVNAVCPGLIDTEMVKATTPAAALETFRTSFPIQRLGDPREVADLICFLSSDQASYVTGAAVDINGGDLMV